MTYAQPVGNGIPPEFRQQFESLGEAVVIHRLTRFEDRAQREAALEWLRQREAARCEAEAEKERHAEQRENRRMALVAACTAVMIVATLSFVILRPQPAPQALIRAEGVAMSGAADIEELLHGEGVLP
jgi:uncharacterized protein YceH (UPF0502 family)